MSKQISLGGGCCAGAAPKSSCCADAPVAGYDEIMKREYVVGSAPGGAGRAPIVSTVLSPADKIGSVKVRLGLQRMSYTVEPGLYGVGEPTKDSPVLVSANYKLSFDKLRAELGGESLWILVIDTDGVNVWCAAGKGTFGTTELVERIKSVKLDEAVDHRRIILPQLGAPGVAAHKVKEATGFTVKYGPIEARDIKQYLAEGQKAKPEMRLKTFSTLERVVLIPVEFNVAIIPAVGLSLLFALISGLGGPGRYSADFLLFGGLYSMAIFGAVLSGAVLTPIFLPLLPGKAFSLKGLWPALALVAANIIVHSQLGGSLAGILDLTAASLITVALGTYLSLNFTGSTTYTSLSGVKKEMGFVLPIQIIAAASGIVLWLCARFIW